MMLADTSDAFTGQWVVVMAGAVACLAAVMAIVSYFATRREVDSIEGRVTKIEDQLKETERRLDEKAEKRAVHLHNRVNHINSGINRIAGKLGLQLSNENDYSE
jgi:F0F1-type ATP synthase membrane subunit b/b'